MRSFVRRDAYEGECSSRVVVVVIIVVLAGASVAVMAVADMLARKEAARWRPLLPAGEGEEEEARLLRGAKAAARETRQGRTQAVRLRE